MLKDNQRKEGFIFLVISTSSEDDWGVIYNAGSVQSKSEECRAQLEMKHRPMLRVIP